MAAPNLKEIEWAIHELKNRESSEENYLMLAAYHICRDELSEKDEQRPQIAPYSMAARPAITQEPIGRYGDSEFLLAVSGKDPADAWAIMDRHMEGLRIINRRAYESIMERLRQL